MADGGNYGGADYGADYWSGDSGAYWDAYFATAEQTQDASQGQGQDYNMYDVYEGLNDPLASQTPDLSFIASQPTPIEEPTQPWDEPGYYNRFIGIGDEATTKSALDAAAQRLDNQITARNVIGGLNTGKTAFGVVLGLTGNLALAGLAAGGAALGSFAYNQARSFGLFDQAYQSTINGTTSADVATGVAIAENTSPDTLAAYEDLAGAGNFEDLYIAAVTGENTPPEGPTGETDQVTGEPSDYEAPPPHPFSEAERYSVPETSSGTPKFTSDVLEGFLSGKYSLDYYLKKLYTNKYSNSANMYST